MGSSIAYNMRVNGWCWQTFRASTEGKPEPALLCCVSVVKATKRP